MEEIENPLTEGQIESLWIKGISNVLIVERKVTSNLNVKLNQRIKRGIEQTIGISDF